MTNSSSSSNNNNNEDEDEYDFFILPENLGSRLLMSSSLTSKLTSSSPTVSINDYVSSSIKISNNQKLVCHGRGLIATRDVKVGEILFILKPIITVDINQVLRIYKNKNKINLEKIAETILLKEMKRSIRKRNRLAASFLALRNDHHHHENNDNDNIENDEDEDEDEDENSNSNNSEQKQKQKQLISLMLGKGNSEDVKRIFEDYHEISTNVAVTVDNDNYLLGLIRHNAFGPDFHNYDRMEKEIIQQQQQQQQHSNSSSSTSSSCSGCYGYSRILGHYPFAAMINHGCCSNATRVFYNNNNNNNNSNNSNENENEININNNNNEYMVATATQNITKGCEIIWPYCPPIFEYHKRQNLLKSNYGFQCTCTRCLFEETIQLSNNSSNNNKIQQIQQPPSLPLSEIIQGQEQEQLDLEDWSKILDSLQLWYDEVTTTIDTSTGSSINSKHHHHQQQQVILAYLKLGYAQLYMRYFNEALLLLESSSSVDEKDKVRATILKEATELHNAFCMIHKSCTEHISLLHLCYELSATMSTSAKTKTSTTATTTHYWTEQLKDVHISRYSNEVINNDVNILRTLLKHTRVVLRTKDGWFNANNNYGTSSYI